MGITEKVGEKIVAQFFRPYLLKAGTFFLEKRLDIESGNIIYVDNSIYIFIV